MLRALCAVACFTFLYLGLLAFLRDGRVGVAIGLWIGAGILGAFTARLAVREWVP